MIQNFNIFSQKTGLRLVLPVTTKTGLGWSSLVFLGSRTKVNWSRSRSCIFGPKDQTGLTNTSNREYRFDGRQYVPVPEGMNPMMEPTFVVDKDYYRQTIQDFKQMAESPQCSLVTTNGSLMLVPSTCLPSSI